MAIKPAVQVSKKPQFVPGVDSAIALLEKQPRELVDVTGQWATSETLDGAWMLEKLCRHTSSTSATCELDVLPIILMTCPSSICRRGGICDRTL